MDGDIKPQPAPESAGEQPEAPAETHEEPVAEAPAEQPAPEQPEPEEKSKKQPKPPKEHSDSPPPYGVLAALGMLIFGACLFGLGYTLGEQSIEEPAQTQTETVATEAVTQQSTKVCEITREASSLTENLLFSVSFEDEAEASGYGLYANSEPLTITETGAYEFVPSESTEYTISAKTDLDAEAACEYGPVLILPDTFDPTT